MDDRSFDRLTRALAGASTRRGAIAALGALLAGGAALDGEATRRPSDPGAARRRRNRRCRPACPGGQTCTQGTCTCDNGGTVCGATCCTAIQQCDGGACVDPAPACHALAESCGDGTPCCDGLQCGSGYGGGPVACWPVPGGTCERDEDCSYGSHCTDGACVVDPPPPPPTPSPPACEPSVAVSADPAANGRALQDAVMAAASGDTIFLAAGAYRFDRVQNFQSPQAYEPAGLMVRDKALTIEPCPPGADVVLSCPAGLTADNAAYCVGTTGAAPAPGGSVTLRGLTITASFTSISAVVQALDDLPVTLEDVTVENAKPDGTGVGLSTWVPMTVVGGVTVRTVNAQAAGWYALYATTNDGFITCQTPIAFEGYTTPCPSFVVSEGCGCP